MELNRYDQATVSLWGHSYAHVFGQMGLRPLAEAAMHAVLAGLRRRGGTDLFRCYDVDTAAEIELVKSVMPPDTDDQTLHDVRDAAFFMRWLQLNGRVP